ncbi:uncharacterized protein LOC130749465 isoform X2 [Lotus japonicus]|uniref:uncharacterized protein LOC130749465 isoform X2 n=1 Tax=Lotus japonicus TaxID=34305 RepID=UPI002584622F|nr:uncharacterized protein LOC130749465 isoform X2 [Lotus japonicus]
MVCMSFTSSGRWAAPAQKRVEYALPPRVGAASCRFASCSRRDREASGRGAAAAHIWHQQAKPHRVRAAPCSSRDRGEDTQDKNEHNGIGSTCRTRHCLDLELMNNILELMNLFELMALFIEQGLG